MSLFHHHLCLHIKKIILMHKETNKFRKNQINLNDKHNLTTVFIQKTIDKNKKTNSNLYNKKIYF